MIQCPRLIWIKNLLMACSRVVTVSSHDGYIWQRCIMADIFLCTQTTYHTTVTSGVGRGLVSGETVGGVHVALSSCILCCHGENLTFHGWMESSFRNLQKTTGNGSVFLRVEPRDCVVCQETEALTLSLRDVDAALPGAILVVMFCIKYNWT